MSLSKMASHFHSSKSLILAFDSFEILSDKGGERMKTFEEIIQKYMIELTSFLKETPSKTEHRSYKLIGFSFGGFLALEMANQLQQKHQSVEFVSVIDPKRCPSRKIDTDAVILKILKGPKATPQQYPLLLSNLSNELIATKRDPGYEESIRLIMERVQEMINNYEPAFVKGIPIEFFMVMRE